MSSLDSLLIALAQTITLDALVPLFPGLRPWAMMVGKVVSITVSGISILVAELGLDLVSLLIPQSALLIQCAPGYVLGMYWQGTRCLSLVLGLMCGLSFVLAASGGPLGIAVGVVA
eukprot:EG_transcript_57669